MTVQVVKPAGAGYETLLVLVVCAAIVSLAGAFILVNAAPDVAAGPRTDQLDARRDLSAAEQGLYADLRVAADEIGYLAAEQGGKPSIAELAGYGLPPFIQDATAARRGEHRWQRIERPSGEAYLGMSADVQVAGSLLLRLAPARRDDTSSAEAGHRHALAGSQAHTAQRAEEAASDIWLNRQAGAQAPDSLDDAQLLAAGWRKIAAQFDAGVTRQQR